MTVPVMDVDRRIECLSWPVRDPGSTARLIVAAIAVAGMVLPLAVTMRRFDSATVPNAFNAA